jgi:hypothetical protein
MKDLQKTGLNSEDITTFEQFYRRRLAESGGAQDDQQELEIARDILAAVVNDGLTPTSDGGASYVRRGAVDWSDIDNIQAAQAIDGDGGRIQPSARGKRGGKGGLFQSSLVQAVGVIALIVLGLAYFFWPSGPEGDSVVAEGEGEEDIVLAAAANDDKGLSSGEVYEATPTPRPTLETELLADVVKSGVKTGDAVVPRTLEIRGVSFVVQPVTIKVGDWIPPDVDRAVTWLKGSVINYVLGMNATEDNKQLLASLQPGDQILLRMSTGQAYRFVYAETIRIAPQASEIFWQNRPGLTLALFDSGEETRIVVRALYVPELDLNIGSSAPVQQIIPNRRVVLDDKIAVTFLGSEIIPAPATLQGYAYVGVNCTIESVGGSLPRLTAAFMHHIESNDLIYPMVPASQTRYPELPESILPGEPFTTTIVYAIPQNNLRQEMVWEFAADPAEGERVQATLAPYEGPLEPVINVVDYEIDDETLTLRLKLTAALRNIDLNLTDVDIQGGAFSPAGNYFPWRVPAGETEEFELVLKPDGTGKVVVILLEQGIQVTY